jgi:hypothetical protein
MQVFAWLILQDRVWTMDKLTRRGWPNCGLRQLCKRKPETEVHIMFKCRYSIRVWKSMKEWLGLVRMDTSLWTDFASAQEWWCSLAGVGGVVGRRKGLSSLLLLVAWKIWNERNARIFKNFASMTIIVLATIKRDASLWAPGGKIFECYDAQYCRSCLFWLICIT